MVKACFLENGYVNGIGVFQNIKPLQNRDTANESMKKNKQVHGKLQNFKVL